MTRSNTDDLLARLTAPCRAAVEAGLSPPPGEDRASPGDVLTALAWRTEVFDWIPRARLFEPCPEPPTTLPESTELPDGLADALYALPDTPDTVSAPMLLRAVLQHGPFRESLCSLGYDVDEIEQIQRALENGADPPGDETFSDMRETMLNFRRGLAHNEDEPAQLALAITHAIAKALDADDGDGRAKREPDPYDWYYALEPNHLIHNLGNELYKLQLMEAAIACYDAALLTRPDLLETHFNRALAYTRLSRYDDALKDITWVIEQNKDLAEAWYTRGLIYEYRGEYDAAIKDYEQALEADPEYSKAKEQIDIARKKKDGGRFMSTNDPDSRHEQERQARADLFKAAIAALEEFAAMKLPPPWRESRARQCVINLFEPEFGRMLTCEKITRPGLVGAEDALAALSRSLVKMTRGSVIITGYAGTGKTAVVKEAAWRIWNGEKPFGGRLSERDVFELIPAALQSNTKYAGMYEERINQLVRVLEQCPKMIVFVDEIHSLFQAATAEYDVFARGNQLFKKYLAEGSVTFIGCTTIQEYRRFIEPDPALSRRFGLIKIDPPSAETTLHILESRRPDMEEYYGLRVPDAVLKTIVDAAEEYLPSRQQPDKSIQLLDEVCAWCATAEPPTEEATPDVPRKALAQMLGRPLAVPGDMSEAALTERLGHRIRGHNETLGELARAVMAGLGGWMEGSRPRGVFLFAGPTGVGKTETARTLADVLGGGREALIEIDCNMLQGSGYNAEFLMHRLMGPPPGVMGYGTGRGQLSRVRDVPEAIVLFDEFEKADPVVASLLLQIIDEGRVEDAEGSVLDFRRSFVIFTTNAGADEAASRRAGFAHASAGASNSPRVTSSKVSAALKNRGFSDEFLARITHTFLFQGLQVEEIRQVLEDRLSEMANEAKERHWRMTWETRVVEHLLAQWEPRYGVRHLIAILRNRIVESVNVAEAQGELNGIEEIRLEVRQPDELAASVPAGSSWRERRNETMVICLV